VRKLTENELHQKKIDQGHGFTPTLYVQFQIYREAILMFYAKASVYLKALQRPVSEQWQAWIE
jgi:hypothetical protein